MASVNDTTGKDPTTQTPRRRFFQWHEPGTSKAEKWLIFKLDWFLLSFSCLCFFVKQLDQNNVTNAYASGLAADLGFGPGNELSWMNTYFNAAVIIGGPFSNLILTVVRPRFWLPFCLFTWSFFVLFLYKCTSAHQFYALRFCIGLFESAAWPGVQYVLGCWYTKSEIARRSGLFVMSGVLGQMFSGYLQSALYSGMEGRGGMPAYRWLFIFDFIIAVPVAIYGLIFYPDTPETTTAFYLSEWERKRAIERMEQDGRAPKMKFDWTIIRRILGAWQLYVFAIAYSLWTLTCGSYVMQYFTLWLKATGDYSIPQINSIPTSLGAVNFVFMISTGYTIDILGPKRRGAICAAVGSLLIFCYAVMVAWDVPDRLKMAAFILAGCYGCYTPILAGWCNSVCGGDQQLRAFVLAFMVSLGQAVVIPFQQLQFPSGQAPEFKETHGWPSGLAFVIALTIFTGVGIDASQRIAERWNKRGTESNATLAYRLAGANDPNTPLIITLHGGRGFGDHSSDFQAFSPLSQDNYRVLSFDYRGHGLSSRTGPYTFAQLVDDIEALRVHFSKSNPVILIAGSFGGFLAQQYAITYPENLSHLILRGTAPSHHHEAEAIETLSSRLQRAPGMSISMLRDKIFGSFIDDTEFRLVMHAAAPLYVDAANFDADRALERARGMVVNAVAHNDLYSEAEKYFDYRSSLDKVTAKTLVIVGAEDWICPPKQSEIIAEKVPNAQLVVLSGAGHSVHLEKNSEVLGVIRGFLDVRGGTN
ncbi:alpha/beta-hydrolase [Aspergillus carlsbadensis]|nr:alpha/beta-hydrolase [Aspergillus carlsbadensis]